MGARFELKLAEEQIDILRKAIAILKAENKVLRANMPKSVLRRLDAQFTGGTTPAYFSAQNKEESE